VSTGDDLAYFRLVAENGKVFMGTETEVEIGRDPTLEGSKYWCIQETNTISKNHARIHFDPSKNAFLIKNLSKNKV
jgi:hypothetical protein